jgi:hypothetical protein
MSPLFQTIESLKAYIRITDSNISDPLIELALIEFESEALGILGQTLLDSAKASMPSLCKLAEARYVKGKLMLDSPISVIGSNITARESWNNENVSRESGKDVLVMANRFISEALGHLQKYALANGQEETLIYSSIIGNDDIDDIFIVGDERLYDEL